MIVFFLYLGLVDLSPLDFKKDFYTPPSKPKISENLHKKLSKMHDDRKIKVWVYFTDKGTKDKNIYELTLKTLEKNLPSNIKTRRLLVREEGKLCDFTDIPVHKKYVYELNKMDCEIDGISNWLNAVALTGTARNINNIANEKYVRKIEEVRILSAKLPHHEPERSKNIDYGNAEQQLKQINILNAHKAGFTGKGVRIGLLDTGFEWRKHIGLKGIDVIAEYDFIGNDNNTGYEEKELNILIGGNPVTITESREQIRHGTGMLCLIAGRRSGSYVGSAFNASFALAKTELLYPPGKEDIIMEETWWIRGLEWLTDSIGVDIISNSLGYKEWIDKDNFPYDSLDGKRYPMEIAAGLLWEKGTLLVTAMGNLRGTTSRPDTCIVCPASADSILAVGGVDTLGNWSSFSAIGPRCDRERKPDVSGPFLGFYGLPIYHPDYLRDSLIWTGGTSIATAIIAGAAACIKEAHPKWTPMKIRDVLRKTASLSMSPDNTLGWGIVNATKAIYYEKPVDKNKWDRDKIMAFYPGPYRSTNGYLTISYKLVNSSHVNIKIYTLSGKLIWSSKLDGDGEKTTMGEHTTTWNGKTNDGKTVGSGIYLCYLETGYGYDVAKFAVVK